MPVLDRRTTLQGLSSLIAASAAPSAIAPTVTDWAARLGLELAAAVRPGTGTDLTVLRFSDADGARTMSAAVGMTWPPGLRRRLFEARADTPEAAYAALQDMIVSTFATANPHGIRPKTDRMTGMT